MKIQNAGYFARLLEQVALGKTLQCQSSSGEWWNITANTEVSFTGNPNTWRIKPEPKLRPWKPEEVPVGALLRHNYTNSGFLSQIIARHGEGILTTSGPGLVVENSAYYLNTYEHSLDHGKTWLPCGILTEE